MTLETPSIAEINDNIIGQLEAELNQTIPLFPKAFNRVLAKVLAAVFIMLYKYAGFTFLQMFVSRATYDETVVNGVTIRPLQEWGRLIAVTDLVPATSAELVIDITVENLTGSLPAGTALVNAENGVTYLTIGEVLLNSSTVQATIRAASDETGGGGAGAIGNLQIGDTVSFVDPLANVARNATVSNVNVTASDAETVEAYRQRIIDRFQKRPQGGAYADYEQWGEEVAGIINVYPYTGDCPGTVDLYSEATPESSGNPDGIPTAAQLQAVLDSVELDQDGLPTRRPANAFVNSFAITRTGFDVSVTGVNVDNLAQVESDITDAVTEYFAKAEPFIQGLTIFPRRDRLTRSAIIGLVEDIVTAAGGTFTTATFNVTGSPGTIELYQLGQGEKAKLVDITFLLSC
jgi:uncharacterized phage protein gp47/JayE